MALQPLSPPLPVPPPPSPSPSGGLGGVGQVRGGRHTPTEDLSPSLLQEGKGSGCRPLLMKPEGGFPDGGSPARPGRGGEWGEPWPCCEVGSCCQERIFFEKNSWLQERSREPSPAPDCLQRKIETLRSHPTEIFNFMVVGGTPRLGGCLTIWQYSVRIGISASYSEDDENSWLWHLILACL